MACSLRVISAEIPALSFTKSTSRVHFLLGGRHGDFKFLPLVGYSRCYEALLPKEKIRVEAVKEYKRDHGGVRDRQGQHSSCPRPHSSQHL
ncbi:hypothetical protein J4Q44_G00087380 [Coregonus suidteri]|uniref:Uncharacterized protein n=1 Tax=Coregonus suidteri TaxID=861788 RepID=A0AAN8M949_9TELE